MQSGLDAVVGQIVEAVDGQAGVLSLWSSPEAPTVQLTSYGLYPDQMSALEPLVKEITEQLQRNPAPTLVDTHRLKDGLPDQVHGLQAIAFPLQYGGRLHGFLCLFHPPEATDLLQSHPGLGKIIADQVTVVVQNSRLLQQLTEEKRWLEAVITHSADGILIIDTAQRIVGFNPAFERLSGWRVAEVRGRRLNDVFSLRTSTGDPFDALAPGGGPDGQPRRIELTLRTRTGGYSTSRWLAPSSVPTATRWGVY